MRKLLWFTLVTASVFGTTQADTLYVGEDFGSIVRYDTTLGSGSIATVASASFLFRGLAVDSAGDLFATDVSNNRILKYAPDGTVSVFASTLLNDPHALAFDAMGDLFVANNQSGTIVKFTPSGVGSIFATVANPVGLAFDSTGNLFVSAQQSNMIIRITPGGVSSVFASTGVSTPAGMAFDAHGNLFVSSESTFSIVKYTPSGVSSTFANVPGVSAGLAFDSAGDLYESAVDPGRILRFTPDGQESIFATTSGRPIFLTVFPSAVPEPASLVMLGIGAIAILWFGRHWAPAKSQRCDTVPSPASRST